MDIEFEEDSESITDKEANEEPGIEPECTAKNNGIECEFEIRNGSWWCLSHNCYA